MQSLRTAGSMSGPVFAGFVFDVSCSYYWGFVLVAAALVSVPIALFVGRPGQMAAVATASVQGRCPLRIARSLSKREALNWQSSSDKLVLDQSTGMSA